MAELKIDGRMTVRTLKENFKKEFEGTLRVYNGRELANESATLAAIRTGDAKGGELVCRASRTVGKFEQEMMEVFGIKVQVASPDDWVLVLDGVTLANLKNIPKQARKADMESLVAYKRKVSQIESDSNNEVKDTSGKVLLNSKYKNIPFIDFKFNKIDWELNEDNIEAHREEFDGFGVIYVKAGEDDFDVVVITTCDIADGLYDALDEVEHFIDEGCEFVEVYYTTVWEMYGVAKSYDYADVSGHVLSSLAFCEDNNYDYDLNSPVLCRAIWDDRVQVWLTDKWGDHEDELELNNEINLLIEYKKDPNSVADKIEWQGPKLQCFNINGEFVFEILGDSYVGKMCSNGLINVEIDRKKGFINKKGEEVIPCKYDYVGSFATNGLAYVEIDGKYGFVNENGEEVIPCKYDNADSFAANGFAYVRIDDKYGFINENGEEVIPCKYDDVGSFASNGLAYVEIDGKYGFINEKGEEVIPCKYDGVYEFSSNGLAEVEIDGKYGFINEKGEEVIPCKYDRVWGFSSNGLIHVEIDGKKGFINKKGEEVIPCKYDYVGSFATNGLAYVEIDGKYGFVNESGEEVIPCKYDNAGSFATNGLAKVKLNGKYGFINEEGEEVIPCKYEYVDNFEASGLTYVEMGGKYGCINSKGEEVIPCNYSKVNIIEDLIFVKNN